MNTNFPKTTITPSNYCALLLVSSGLLACTETSVQAELFRAGDATSDGYAIIEDPQEIPGPGTIYPETHVRDFGDPSGDPTGPQPDEDGCHAIYAQDLLPTFELTIDDKVWDALQWEWENGAKQEEKGFDVNPYHPLDEFRYGEIVITNAEIRLRGNPSYWNVDDKYQFQIAFDRVDKKGHFLGLEKLAFDAATYNRHMLRDRLAWSIFRDMGIIAPCANNARLDINGDYYGLFTSIEKVDKIFLERNFDDPHGDLWKRQGWELQTNKKSSNDDRLDELNDANSIAELETYLDIETALKVYAAEAIVPDSDGGWAGGWNFYLYDDPLTGKFVLIPWDMDNTFEVFNDGEIGDYPNNPDPVVWHKVPRYHGRPYYDLALTDEDWFWYYIDAIEAQVDAGYDADVLHERIDTWTDQIKESVFEDKNKPYSDKLYLKKVQELHDFVEARADFLDDWLECWQDGGEPNEEGYCDE